MKIDGRSSRRYHRVRVELTPGTVAKLENACHQRDCSMDTLINEMIDVLEVREKRRG